jgi:hypothetical protein
MQQQFVSLIRQCQHWALKVGARFIAGGMFLTGGMFLIGSLFLLG